MNLKIAGLIFLILVVLAVSGCTSNSANDFKVGNSTYQLSGDWKQTATGNGTVRSNAIVKKSDLEVMITQYNSSTDYNRELEQAANNYEVSNLEIAGVSVKNMNSTAGDYPVYLYYFEKNGKYYRFGISDTSLSIANTDADKKIISDTATKIISTLK